jgi:5'-nucleotidase
VLLGLPAIAVSQQSSARTLNFRPDQSFEFAHAAQFVARLVEEIDDVPLPSGTLLNINCPGSEPGGVAIARLGKRIYRDELKLMDSGDGRSRYWIYGPDPGFHEEDGTDFAAVGSGYIAVTPLHFDLTDTAGMDALDTHDLARLLLPIVQDRD